jgi:hypothetical protein
MHPIINTIRPLSIGNDLEALAVYGGDRIAGPMKKDSQFTFRIPADLKKHLEAIARDESRSVAQICEAFLRASAEAYKKEGSRFLQRFLAQRSQNK